MTAIKDQTLIPRPEFQRRLVWTHKHKQDFVQTILIGYPFPEIYIAAGDVDPDTGVGTELLVDGQQRLTTLYQYFYGSPDLRLGELRPYSQLSNEEKMRFLEYQVVVRDLGKKTIEEIKQVFTRINSTKYSLNAMEIHNARFDGEFKKFGEKLSEDEFFEEYRVFKTNDIRRMGDLVFCLTLAITIMTNYFNRDDEIEVFLEKYNDEFGDSERIYKEIRETFDVIRGFNLELTSRAWRKAELLNLVMEVNRLFIRSTPAISIEEAGKNLKHFYDCVNKQSKLDQKNADITKYYKAAIQATNDRSNRIRRGEVIKKALCGEIGVNLGVK